MDTKVCSTCGIEKSVDNFRPYYGGRKGRYSFCKECEKIEQRRKYLNRQENLSDEEQAELSSINKLYDMRQAAGLKKLGSIRSKSGVSDIVAKQMEGLNESL